MLGHDPTKRLLVISYGLELAVSSRMTAAQSNDSTSLQIDISRHSDSREECCVRNRHHSGRISVRNFTDGSLTGRGGDIMIIDDPLKLSDAASDIKREHVNDTYQKYAPLETG